MAGRAPGPVWVVGARGLLGSALCRALADAGVPFRGTGSELSALEEGAVGAFVRSLEPAWVINGAGWTDVDAAECDEAGAYALNAEAARILARAAAEAGAGFVQVSTDYVFDGRKDSPYVEADEPDPINAYGRTKLAGERLALAGNEATAVVRSSRLYGHAGRDFVRTMLGLMAGRDALSVVDDQVASPTSAAELAASLVAAMRTGRAFRGTFHCAGAGEASWYRWALAIRDCASRHDPRLARCRLEPIPGRDYPAAAARPPMTALDSSAMAALTGLSLPPWEDSLRAFIDERYREAP